MLVKPKRVLHIVSAMNRGGAETLIMNVYRNIDRSKVQFDFISHINEEGHFDEEIESLGGKIFRIPSLGQIGPVRYIKNLIAVMKSNEYIAVHAHTDYQCGFPALAAKIAGIKIRVSHSHSSNWLRREGIKSNLILKGLQILVKYGTTDYCACSNSAGRFLFGQSSIDNKRVTVLNNGIDLEHFSKVNIDDKFSIRSELCIPQHAKIIGHVGTFSESKNQLFILKILKNLLGNDNDFYVAFVGDGHLQKFVEKEAQRLQISDNVRFLGVRSDIPRILKAFDVFLFPSIFEGFGIVTIEAQSLGVPCIVSDVVPKKTNMELGLISYLSLEDNIQKWIDEINISLKKNIPNQKDIHMNIKTLGFDIKENISDWKALYGV